MRTNGIRCPAIKDREFLPEERESRAERYHRRASGEQKSGFIIETSRSARPARTTSLVVETNRRILRFENSERGVFAAVGATDTAFSILLTNKARKIGRTVTSEIYTAEYRR